MAKLRLSSDIFDLLSNRIDIIGYNEENAILTFTFKEFLEVGEMQIHIYEGSPKCGLKYNNCTGGIINCDISFDSDKPQYLVCLSHFPSPFQTHHYNQINLFKFAKPKLTLLFAIASILEILNIAKRIGRIPSREWLKPNPYWKRIINEDSEEVHEKVG